MVRRLTEDPPLVRPAELATATPGGRIGAVEPVMPRSRRRRGPDWGLALITLIFLGSAAALVYYGVLNTGGGLLGLGESRTLSARPDTTIPDPDAVQPLDQLAPGFTGTTAPSGAGTAAAPSAGALPVPAGGAYNMNQQTRQGGAVESRPEAHAAPTPAGPSIHDKPRSVAPGRLIAPPGARPVP